MVDGMANIGVLEMVGRLALAGLLGGLLGLEREYAGQDAGFRTHMLVVLGSALFGYLSVGGFDDFVTRRDDSNVTVDVTRIAAYVAPGIGFIGGGAILKHGGRVTGITTAGSLWSAAAVGVAVGVGQWAAALVVTLIALASLALLKPIGLAFERMGRRHASPLEIRLDAGSDLAAVIATIDGRFAGQVREIRFGEGPGPDSWVTVTFWRHPPAGELAEVAARLRDVDGVTAVTVSVADR